MYLLIPAAGSGRRMGSDRNKLLLPLLGKPLLAWTLLAARESKSIRWVGLVGQPVDFPDFKEIINAVGMSKMVHLIPGGSTRQESVYLGLQNLPVVAERVLIHDGARCLVTPGLLDRCVEAIQTCPGLIAAIPVKDTIKIVDSTSHLVSQTPARENLWAAQTPQAFVVEELMRCHTQGRADNLEVTDDAALFEHYGQPVKIVEGEETNLKITTPLDLAIAEFILRQRLNKTL
ncbi:MAG TPA: 2-C-methyl-D-erythritol 4-phosphate cytidylyltransferase [Leptolyngbyaceae cyanobacterium M33_DOE_097]|uniref:2-C-methyl-D-erythritol 4-phosphate cytidylyltransferase n=1 Tax=Oscillatoriales cyanobacterium SpSt-418 TaxID=2282169 RepID=A0A7C3PRZ0_9CYAN|nr:2-C-methyl-D-erythritol 4-phosphate cytidylyltransferase [Leptolyngbyaceae cyanobacterium M33_DOE_097]